MPKRSWVKPHKRKDGVLVKGHYRTVGNHVVPQAIAGTRFQTYRGRHFQADSGPYPAEVDGVKGQASYSMMKFVSGGGTKEEGEWQVFFRREGADPSSFLPRDSRGWVFGSGPKGKKKAKKFLKLIRTD